MLRHSNTVVLIATLACTGVAAAQDASSSLLERAMRQPQAAPLRAGATGPGGAASATSLFAVAPPEPRQFAKHDLIQVIVFESSRAKSEHEIDLSKDYGGGADVDFNWPPHLTDQFDLGLTFDSSFGGDGEYERKDDFSARVTTEIIEVLPNGNLVIEGRTVLRNDTEAQDIRLTGICRPQDITAANTVLSNQVHDLRVEKVNSGELKTSTTKNIFAKVLDLVFVWRW